MEVAEIRPARAAPATNESNKWPAVVLSSGGAGAMWAMSFLFACLAAVTLRRCGAMDEEEAFPSVLWGLSPLICLYLYSWTAALSPAAPWAKHARSVAARVAVLLLVAAAADKLIGPIAGAAAIVLATLISAGVCGGALAKRRQHAGTERWSAATVASTLIYRSRAEERDQEGRVGAVYCILAFPVAASVFAVLLVRWVWPETEWEAPPTVVVFFLAGPLILAVRLMPPWMVGGAPVMDNFDDTHFTAAVIGVIGWLVVTISAGVSVGIIAGAVVFWVGELGMVGFLGYYLAVEAHYEQIMAMERRKPRTAKDASGLLDGRDGDDACSAHIDAADGFCVGCVLPRRCNCKHTCRSQIRT